MAIIARIDANKNLMLANEICEVHSMPMPTFSRSSVAYKSDGSQVAANMPRYEAGKFGQAVMVEEGTTNLVSNPSFESGMWPELYQSANGTTTLVSGWNGSGNAARITIAMEDAPFGIVSSRNMSLSEGVTYTISFRARAIRDNFPITYMYLMSSTVGNSRLPTINVGTTWQRYTITYTIPAGITASDYGLMIAIDSRDSDVYANDWIEVDDVQLEAKPYATSFIDGTRSPETLTIPTAGVLNPQEGTVELTYIPFLDSSKVALGGFGQDWWWIFGAGSSQNTNELRLVYNNGAWHVRVGGSSDTTYSMSFAAGDKISLALAWKQGVDARLFINGVKVATFTPSNFDVGTIASIGWSYLWNGYRCNGLIDDLRISNRARTDEEIAAAYQSGQPLLVDKDTTYKINFDGNLNPSANLETMQLDSNGKLWLPEFVEGSSATRIAADKTLQIQGELTEGVIF